MTFARPPAGDDPQWPRASAWLAGSGGAPSDAPLLRVVGVPSSVGSISPSRADQTPAAVRQALARLSPFDPTHGVDLGARLRVEDFGDWPIADLPLQDAMDAIENRCSDLDDAPRTTIFLGGDNAVTRPIVTGLHGNDLSRVGVITLDAHHDVRHLDDGPRNGTPIRGLIADGLDPTNVVQIGIGRFTNSADYAAWCHERGIGIITAPQVHADGIEAAIAQAFTQLTDVDVIHVDLDIDVLDVAFAPACPGARPGGLTPEQLFIAAELLAVDDRVRSFDLVEVDATTDHEGRTVMVTAMTLLTIAAAIAR